jgi:pyruvate/2-oxoglutarate dehydrogenase complex dihydrolipoamide dehydrogenase (E3) component
VGKKVVVIGGGMVGCETADWLSGKGSDVTIVEMLEDLGLLLDEVKGLNEMLLLRRLCEKGVRILINTKVEAITKNGVNINHKGIRKTLEADTVVLATGARSNRAVIDELKTQANVNVIGDCRKPGKLVNAIHEGFAAASKL